MDDRLEELIAQGYTPAEAELVVHVCKVQAAERDAALRTGLCGCGAQLRLRPATKTLECSVCSSCHAA